MLCPSYPGSSFYLKPSESMPAARIAGIQWWKARLVDVREDKIRVYFESPVESTLPPALHPLAWAEAQGDDLIVHLSPVLPGIRFYTHAQNEELIHSVQWQSFGPYETYLRVRTAPYRGYSLRWPDPLQLEIRFKRTLPETPTVVIDAGHGGSESGACRGSLCEKMLTLRAAEELASLLTQAGNKVLLTRTDDQDVTLEQRVQFAENAQADLLLSLHTDSWPPGGRLKKPPVGLSCYYQQHFVRPIAFALCANDGRMPTPSTPWVTRRSLYLLHSTEFPSLLLEMGNLQDRTDRQWLSDPTRFSSSINALASKITVHALQRQPVSAPNISK